MSRSDQNHKYHGYDIIRKLVMAFGLTNQEIRGIITSQLIHFLVILMTDITIWSPCWVMISHFMKIKIKNEIAIKHKFLTEE